MESFDTLIRNTQVALNESEFKTRDNAVVAHTSETPKKNSKVDPQIHSAIVHALTAYDRKQSTKKFYNPYALGIYFKALEEAEQLVAKGKSYEDALALHFTDRLLTPVLKALKTAQDKSNKGTDNE